MKQFNRLTQASAIMIACLMSASAFAKNMKVCGSLEVDQYGQYSVTEDSQDGVQGSFVQIEADSDTAKEKLYSLTQPLYTPTIGSGPRLNAKVCITGYVILNDEDKGIIVGVKDPNKIVEQN